MKAKILKKLTHNGVELESGTIVDVSSWRNAKTLEGSRYITFVSDSESITEEKEETPKTKSSKTKTVE